MSMTEAPAPRQHAYTGPALPQLPEPTYAERVRTLVSLHSVATLSTLSRRHEGFPFGSLMPYALDHHGRPVFLISNMAMHTQNLRSNPRTSLFVGEPAADGDVLGAARATLVGSAAPVATEELSSVRELYLARHENSRSWVDFQDFHFFRLEPLDIYYVGGFGVMGWVPAEAYAAASVDPLAAAAPGILAHMNADHVDSMALLARTHTGFEASEAEMTAVDRLGFHLRLKTADGMKGTRLNYPHEISSAQEMRKALVEMVRHARESL
jgi:putative heme iron utilization protein